ncbi:HlyD family efflux transporter periplasmic adaptor subunit [Blastopirellula sp. JC732]|uniref:HlyD family efflux transporter periplasmic adaptor subunit n=1 Tax=Blastopirellula sediminis TaxID=2894196 RepID=A0A9X1MT97_9BACT|nr:HlyD family efflux transporter periplasmic adaptor subunit [Blastopirellula sediminis]MCC9604616.1 HlyD family efflux transporter periplasmic adaptor subunit [Blastopirellula sediminis]MCC9632085.1 HlyD family efflux transporter periplasmic adaptor subunit [Blastopirellula sediminis]
MTLAILLLAAAVGQVPASPSSAGDVVVDHCLVSLLDQVNVPAQETGMLVTIPAYRGRIVVDGDLLAQIDDRTAAKQAEIAKFRHDKATTEAANDIDVRYATKAAEVALKEHEVFEQSNKESRGTISKIQLDKAWLAYQRAVLQIEQAAMNQKIAGLAAAESRAEMEGAEMVMDRCRTESPINGVVVQVYRQEGEWVRPGDPLLRIIGLQWLKVEGTLDADQHDPSQLIHRPVTVTVRTPSGMQQFSGFVNFVSPEIDATGAFDISAVVENRQTDKGYWALAPGDIAGITVHIDRQPVPQTELERFRNRNEKSAALTEN